MKFLFKYLLCAMIACCWGLNACDCDDCQTEGFRHVVRGIVTVAQDNSGNPVKVAYKAVGKNDGRPVILFSDPYLGIDSWQRQQRVFGKDFYTIAYDRVGYGLSSKNDPTDLDGVNGQTGYSFRQRASFAHELVQQLDIQGPLIWVGTDLQAQVGMWYITDYPDGPYAVTKMAMEDSSADAIVSNDPCSLAYASFDQIQQIVQLFYVDPVQAATLFLGGSFITQNCPAIENVLINLVVDYVTTTTPDIFARQLLGTLTEDVSPLMANITIPTLNTYGTTGDNHPISRLGVGITFFGKIAGYSNPAIPGDCTSGCGTYVAPFPNTRFITYPGHGTLTHVTTCRKFNRDLRDFITGDDANCSICLPMAEHHNDSESL